MVSEGKLLEYLRRVTAELQQTRTRLADMEVRQHEPIAIIGMFCRHPGEVRSGELGWRGARPVDLSTHPSRAAVTDWTQPATGRWPTPDAN